MNSSNELLRVLLKDNRITALEIKTFFRLNSELTVELILNFLDDELNNYNFYNNNCQKYLFNALNVIEGAYQFLYDEGKSKMPYIKKHKEILQTIRSYGKNIDHIKNDKITPPEELFLDIYYYQDLDKLESDLKTNSIFINGKMNDKPLIKIVLENFLSEITNLDTREFSYFKKVIKVLMDHSYEYGNIQGEILNFNKDLLNIKFDTTNLYRKKAFFNLLNEYKHNIEKNDSVVFTYSNNIQNYDSENIFTIDGKGTNVKDDAISIKSYQDHIDVNLYIADINDLIKEYPYFEREAYESWFNDKNNLFTNNSIRNSLSLNVGELKKSLVYKFTFDKKYKLKSIDLSRGSIKVKRSYDYDEVNNILNSRNLSKSNPQFRRLYALTKKLERDNQQKQKYHELKEIIYGIEHNKRRVVPEAKESQTIVSELKIIANHYQAKICGTNNIPMMYRFNNIDNIDESLDIIKRYCNMPDKEEELKEYIKLIKLDSQYSTVNKAHNGLNLDYYGHCTTPIRNYFSLLNQRSFSDIILNDNYQKITRYSDLYNQMENLQGEKIRKRLIKQEKKRLNKIDSEYMNNLDSQIVSLLKDSKLNILEISAKLGLSHDIVKESVNKLVGDLYLICENNNYYCPLNENVFRAVLSIKKEGYGFAILETGEEIFIPKRNVYGFLDNSIIIVRKKEDKDKSYYGQIMKGSTGSKKGIINSSKIKFKTLVKMDNSVYQKGTLVKDLSSSLVSYKKEANSKEEPNKEYYLDDAIDGIGQKDNPETDILSILRSYDINPEFPDDVLKEVVMLPKEVTNTDIENRIDLRNEKIFTIDGADAKDFDDAINVKVLDNGNYQLGVHIADVSYYVKEDTAIDKEASVRATSVYVADRVVPMLPEELSNYLCSLRPDEDRLTMSVLLEITPNGEIVNKNIFNSVICSKKRMKYHEVNDILDGNYNSYYSGYENDLNLALELSHIVRSRRKEKGAINLDSPKTKFIIDENGKPTDVYPEVRGEAERIIEDFMIIANEAIASFLTEEKVIAPYRIHDRIDLYKLSKAIDTAKLIGYDLDINLLLDPIPPHEIEKALDSIRDDKNFDIIANLVLRSMDKACYSINNIGHYALASEDYTHFTSPIRRHPDLMVHRILKRVLDNNYNLTQAIGLETMMDYDSLRERNAEECEKEINRIKACELMSTHIGETFTCRIISLAPNGILVKLPNFIQGFIPKSNLSKFLYNEDSLSFKHKNENIEYKIGDEIESSLVDCNMEQGMIVFIPNELVKIKKLI